MPGSGRSPGEGNGNPLQYTCLENPVDREAWWATVHGVAESRTQLSDITFTFTCVCYRRVIFFCLQMVLPKLICKERYLVGLK